MNYTALMEWLTSEPASGWPVGDSQEIADWCNAAVIDRDRTHLPAAEIWGVILGNRAEWLAMTAEAREVVANTLAFNEATGVPTAVDAIERTTLVAILGTNTKQQLAARIPETITRVAAQTAVGAQEVSNEDIDEAKRRAGV